MKKILLLTRFVKEYEPVRLREESIKFGLGVDMIKYGTISFGVVDGKEEIDLGVGKELRDYDWVLPRAASKKGSSMVGVKTVILSQLDSRKVLNGLSFEKYPLLGKMEQGVRMAKLGISTVDFVSFGSKKGWMEFQEEPAFDFPMIIKGRFGSHGRTVSLVSDWDEFDEIFRNYKAGSVLVQPKIKARQWYRCVVVGGRYLGEMRHRQKDRYGGGEEKLVRLSDKKMERLRELCLAVSKAFEIEYAGIDVIYDEEIEDFRIMEVNRTAQFKYFEKRTGVNVAARIIEYLASK